MPNTNLPSESLVGSLCREMARLRQHWQQLTGLLGECQGRSSDPEAGPGSHSPAAATSGTPATRPSGGTPALARPPGGGFSAGNLQPPPRLRGSGRSPGLRAQPTAAGVCWPEASSPSISSMAAASWQPKRTRPSRWAVVFSASIWPCTIGSRNTVVRTSPARSAIP